MTAGTSHAFRRLSHPVAAGLVAVGIALVGWIDFSTGIEYRVNSLYYLPLSLAAWTLGGPATMVTAAVCTAVWFACNYYGGLEYSSSSVWFVNIVMQGISFGIVGFLITTVRRALAQAEALSRTDAVSSLLNSRAFGSEAGQMLALARRHGRPVTLAYIDLDNFKAVNDTHGHRAGDAVLRRVGELLRTSLRTTDLAARIGGDEFAVLFAETGPEAAGPTIERLRSRLAELHINGIEVKVSVGALCCVRPPVSIDAMLGRADRLMYGAKTGGKDRIRLEIVHACDSAN